MNSFMGYDLYRINLVYSVVRTVVISMLKRFLQGFDILLNLSKPATSGLEETGHCRGVESRVNVWTFRQKSGRCGEVAAGGSTVVSAVGPVSL